MFDIIKADDYLVDQDAAEILTREASVTVDRLERKGFPLMEIQMGK
jgi:succinate dehydrogenase/fumarate reductase flavoprotein subunit